MKSDKPSETILRELRPTRLLFAHYYALMMILLAGALLVLLGFFPVLGSGFNVALSGTLTFLSLVVFLMAEVRRLSHKYIVYDHRVGVAEGILRKRVQYLPFTKVERVEVNQSFLGRIFGVGNLVVDTGEDLVTLQAIRSPSKVEQLVSERIHASSAPATASSA